MDKFRNGYFRTIIIGSTTDTTIIEAQEELIGTDFVTITTTPFRSASQNYTHTQILSKNALNFLMVATTKLLLDIFFHLSCDKLPAIYHKKIILFFLGYFFITHEN